MVRRLKDSDIDRVLGIWLDASVRAHDFMEKEFWESRLPEMRDIYLPASETYVSVQKGEVKGFLSLHGDTLAALFVDPDAQGRGIGTRLMAKAKSLRNRIYLTVYRENRRAIDFYLKCGFRGVKEQVDEHTGHKELLMVFSVY